jgi:RNA polymerase sigma-70 factor (ECF subfamily)
VAAQRVVLLRYYQPIFRYLRAMVRDDDTAEELTHEFAVRFLRGDFRRADPSRGRFRDLLKRSLRHLVIDHWRRQRVDNDRAPIPLVDDWQVTPAEEDWHRSPPPRRSRQGTAFVVAEAEWRKRPPPRRGPAAPDVDNPEAARAFLEDWRREVLDQAWEALDQFQGQTGSPYHTILRLRTEHPEERSAGLARLASARLGRPLSEASFRQLLHRSREKFAGLLVDAVARTLTAPDPDAIEEELIELDLLSFCQQSVARLRAKR